MRPRLLPIALLLTAALAADLLAQPSIPGPVIRTNDIGDGRWHWIEVEAARGDPTGWTIYSGTADVRITGALFHADLKVAAGQEGADIAIDGHINGDRIRAKEVLLNTDASPATICGTLRRKPLGSIVEERIAFRGGQSGDASFLGLYRRMRPRR